VTVLSLGISVCLLGYIRSVVFLKQSLAASKQLHQSMISAVLRAKVEFFDTNPSGRILNRFAADVGSNDVSLCSVFFFDIVL
jgi:ATP-binding cassette subfamily C (CFTR/MRP) protein 4